MKLFLDNCLAPKHARALNELLRPQHQVTHLRDKFAQNTADDEWLSQLGAEGDWIVITGDFRISRNKHLRTAWRESGLTVFFLKKGWTSIPPMLQHSKLTARIEQIIELAERHPRGAGFAVSAAGKIEKVS